MSKLLELAERVEKAEGPDRWIDAEIMAAIGAKPNYEVDWRGWGFDASGNAIERPVAFPYTASLDAALTLVPEGAKWSIADDTKMRPFAQVIMAPSDCGLTEGHTPALALCAAALRARAAMETTR